MSNHDIEWNRLRMTPWIFLPAPFSQGLPCVKKWQLHSPNFRMKTWAPPLRTLCPPHTLPCSSPFTHISANGIHQTLISQTSSRPLTPRGRVLGSPSVCFNSVGWRGAEGGGELYIILKSLLFSLQRELQTRVPTESRPDVDVRSRSRQKHTYKVSSGR